MEYNRNNVFAKIIRGEIKSERVGENDNFIAIRDLHPQAPVHILIIPKKEFASLEDIDLEQKEMMGEIFQFAREIARQEKIADNYRLMMNVGPAVQQVHHLHLHLLGGWPEGQEPK